jgi:hypothetical protein
MHLKRIPQHMRLMPRPPPQALLQRPLIILQQHPPIIRVRTPLNNHPRPLPRTQPPHIREPLLRHHHVQIMLRLVYMARKRHYTRDACRIGRGGARGRRVHDAELRVAQEVRGAADPVEHARAQGVGRVGVRVDVHLERRVHGDDPEAPDELGRVGDLLRAQEQSVFVVLPVYTTHIRTDAECGRRKGGGRTGRGISDLARQEAQEERGMTTYSHKTGQTPPD